MNEVIKFSEALRSRTWPSHSESEGASFIRDLMSGKGTRDDYISMLIQHYFIYDALESVEQDHRDDPIAAMFIDRKLTRMPAIISDLEHLLGSEWREQAHPLPTTRSYVERLNTVARSWVGGFIAHHYTRYLGDLSGGQMISRILQRDYGFDTNGVGFYLFADISDPKQFKNHYRSQLDQLPWSQEELDRVIDEVGLAYQLNTELFIDLARAKATA